MLWWCHDIPKEDLTSPQVISWPPEVSWYGWGGWRSCEAPCLMKKLHKSPLTHTWCFDGPCTLEDDDVVIIDLIKTWNPWCWPWCPYKDHETCCLLLIWLDGMMSLNGDDISWRWSQVHKEDITLTYMMDGHELAWRYDEEAFWRGSCVCETPYLWKKQTTLVCGPLWMLNGTLIMGSLMKPLWLVKPLAMMMWRSTPIRFKFKLNIKNIK